MIALFVGTPGSGKSARAEDWIVDAAKDGDKVYLATMIPFGEEGRLRVERHRRLRANKGFVTIERPTDVAGLRETIAPNAKAACLLECVSNLVGNEAHSDSNKGLSDDELVEKIALSIETLAELFGVLAIVTNEFPADAPDYDDETRRYVRLVDAVNARLAAFADHIDQLKEGKWVSREIR